MFQKIAICLRLNLRLSDSIAALNSRPCHGYLTEYILKIGKRLKVNNIALDVVSFPHKDQEFDALKTITLRSFVAAANNKDNNSHFCRNQLVHLRYFTKLNLRFLLSIEP
ncbi:26S proteasome non-ATPase regulatory subunit 4 [Tanacetum coccineum]